MSIRIGCHFGPVVLENRDVFGATVHTANRMTSQAKAGQIITTAATVERALARMARLGAPDRHRDASRGRATRSRSTKCCGRPRMSPACCRRSPWRRAATAHHAPAAALSRTVNSCSTSSTPASPSAAPKTTTVVVKGNLISRLHARIEINRNKFVLIDQSTNGTFVQGADGEESFVRRDSLQIKGAGDDRARATARAGLAADHPVPLRRKLTDRAHEGEVHPPGDHS